ncbi:MAG: hypothetical protein GY765_27395 [bacterium]|nr:hypothetical protein [bacterium]
MTEKVYYSDTEITQFQARILDVQQGKKHLRVILDRTCFFPEGGGQPADKGFINDIPVLDVQKEDGTVIHTMDQKPEGETVTGKIDEAWRHDFMQQHTGQHILSGALWKTGQFKTVSVHMGTQITTIEIEAPAISEETLLETETLANTIICQNLPVFPVETDHSQLTEHGMRKPTDRQGLIRLVKIGDFDCVACGGMHLDSTAKAQLVKATAVEKIRGNVRISWKIGQRALDDYAAKHSTVTALKTLLGTAEDKVVEITDLLLGERDYYKKQANALENALAEKTAEFFYAAGLPVEEKPYGVIVQVMDGEEDRFVKKVLKLLVKKENTVICLVNEKPGKLLWNIGCSPGVEFPFDEIKSGLLAPIEGKGGGRSPIWQGTGMQAAGLQEFLAIFKSTAGLKKE